MQTATEFQKDFDLETMKMNEVSMAQIKFAEKLAYKTGSQLPTTSQMLKYCSSDVMSDMIDAMKAGEKIKLS